MAAPTQRSELLADIQVIDRQIAVRFDANVADELDWEFQTGRAPGRNQAGRTKANLLCS